MSKTHELLVEGLLEHGRLRSHQLFARAAARPYFIEQKVAPERNHPESCVLLFFIPHVLDVLPSCLQKSGLPLDKGEHLDTVISRSLQMATDAYFFPVFLQLVEGRFVERVPIGYKSYHNNDATGETGKSFNAALCTNHS